MSNYSCSKTAEIDGFLEAINNSELLICCGQWLEGEYGSEFESGYLRRVAQSISNLAFTFGLDVVVNVQFGVDAWVMNIRGSDFKELENEIDNLLELFDFNRLRLDVLFGDLKDEMEEVCA